MRFDNFKKEEKLMFNSNIQFNNHGNQQAYLNSMSFKGRINFAPIGESTLKSVNKSLDKKDLKALNKVLKYLKGLPRLKFAMLAPKDEVINVRLTHTREDSFQTGIWLEHNENVMHISNNRIRLIGTGTVHDSLSSIDKDKGKSYFKIVREECNQFVNDVIKSCKPEKPLKADKPIESPTENQTKTVLNRYFNIYKGC